MSFKHITSRDNPIFKQLKKFADNAKERRTEGKTLLDGVHLIESYMATFGLPDVVIIPEGKSTVEVGGADQLVSTLQLIKQAVEAGELDAQIEAASGALRSGFKR